ncbi:nuclear pore protein 84/107 [Auriculariales sp. MPI-PUGE-AT-0066]|nr:nuclear pore protein 84/107 [Auriculariales sp. MPI-PUGE-AT-0066]
MEDDLDVAYAQTVTKFSPNSGRPRIILQEESGLVEDLRKALDRKIQAATDEHNDEDIPLSEVAAMRAERDTWSLLHSLAAIRVFPDHPTPTAQEVLAENAFATPQILVGRLVAASKPLRELMTVKTWAEDTAPEPMAPEPRTGYWNYTRHRILHNKRVAGSKAASAGQGNMVTEMDPDAVSRQPGATLDANDDGYERALGQAVYAYIRAGRLETAIDMCKSLDHPWRSAILRGSELFNWSLFSVESPQDDDDMVIDDLSADSGGGNKRRRLWKETCVTAARSTSLNQSTRAMYAALAPQRRTLPVLLSQCRTWTDHLWAHSAVLFEERVDAQLGQLKGCFWLSGLDALHSPEQSDDAMQDVLFQDEETWKLEAQRELSSLKEVAVEEGRPAWDIYHITQLLYVMDQSGELINTAEDYITSTQFEALPSSEKHRIVRFFAHLCLFMKYLGLPPASRAFDVILRKYLGSLEAAKRTDLIALYAATLGASAIERYAEYLAGLDAHISNEERRAGLRRAAEHQLDAVLVAESVADKVGRRAFKDLPKLQALAPDTADLYAPHVLKDEELLLITSVEWLVFSPQTYPSAVELVNSIVRYFLAMGNINAAQEAMARVPSDLAKEAASQAQRVEHFNYQRFLELWQLFSQVVQHAAEEPQSTGAGGVIERETRGAWIRDYTRQLEALHGDVIYLLTNDWLKDAHTEGCEWYLFLGCNILTSGTSVTRQSELDLVRQLYIPEIIIRLHAALIDSGNIAIKNIRLALELANVVADSRYSLADEFFGSRSQRNRLQDYLAAVRTATIKGMELSGTADPFKFLSN